MAVELRKMRADAAKIDEPVDGAQQVILWDMILKRELVEQRRLRFLPRSHHRRSSPSITGIESAVRSSIKQEFFNKISPMQTHILRQSSPISALMTRGQFSGISRDMVRL
ncbi:hypothetical protein PEL8287_03956 [Roseovarius litorisediminis]|uniref:Uncharacterized protein n=1 Tax=Roseovarius litorisediminis TaxID=1312363 RepID=A0A1Y5TYW6_9RHOB|nr:hypothetical protein PEL8287_03956 [Roseovarius litorisediminis]